MTFRFEVLGNDLRVKISQCSLRKCSFSAFLCVCFLEEIPLGLGRPEASQDLSQLSYPLIFLQIKSLIRKYILRQETINLVVVPANVDIATTEALRMAQDVDPQGDRTIGKKSEIVSHSVMSDFVWPHGL